jgi:hypothetical protein
MVVFQRTFTSNAKRTLSIKVLGTARRPTVDIDSFFIISDPLPGAATASLQHQH